MSYRSLYVFCEGNDDERFFNKRIKPKFEKQYNNIKLIKYAQEENEWRNNFINSIKSMSNADYIYITDINSEQCITNKKGQICDKLASIEEEKIIIVSKEIESWYVSGINEKDAKKFKISIPRNTDNFTKEDFDRLKPKNFDSRIDFMIEILRCFCIKTAKSKNTSFKYFIEKHKLSE